MLRATRRVALRAATVLIGVSLAFGVMTPAISTPEPLRIATYALPPGDGNPYLNTNFPGILVWPAIFDALTDHDRDGKLIPALAERWYFEDRLTWVFELRRDVNFSNGGHFSAQTVVDVIAHLVEPDSARYMTNRHVRGIRSVGMRDEYTVVFKTKAPDPGFPGRMAAIQMVPIEYFRHIGADAFAQRPVGTGPYKVDEWGSNRVVLSANPDSWRAPRIDKLIIREMPEATSRIQGLLSGSLDIAINLSPDEETLIADRGGRLHTRQLGGTSVISFITEKESPLKNPLVRMALNLAVDKRSIVDVLLAGKTITVGQPAVRTAFGFDPSLGAHDYDPRKAKRMLIEAGYPDGFDMTTDVVSGGSANVDAIYQKVAADLAGIGVRMKLNRIPIPKLVEGINQGSFKGIAFWMNYSTLPTLNTLEPMELHSCLWPRPWHCDEDVTALVRKAKQEFDPRKRKVLIGQVLRALHEDPPAIWLFESVAFDGVGPRVNTYDAYLGTIRYDRINLVEHEPASTPVETVSD